MEIMKRLVREEEGQGMVEYALIIALISIAVVTLLTAVGTDIGGIFTKISNRLKGVADPA